MIDSLFIITAAGNHVVQRHFRGTIPRTVCEPLVDKLRSCEPPEHLPGVLCTNRRQALIHILRDKIVFLAVVSQEQPPLVVFELLERVQSVLVKYLGEVSEDTLRQNFSTVYLLLDEMIDSGLPFTTELNTLETIIAPPSTLNKVVQAVSGGSTGQVLSDVPPEAAAQSGALGVIGAALGTNTHTQIGTASSEVWWRKQNVVYASNEVYVDIVESIDCIVNGQGHVVAGGLTGQLLVNSKLSGMPEVLLSFRNPGVLQNVSFHPCVRLHRYGRDRMLSFVPPDGEFLLASYWIPDTTIGLPFNFSATVSYHAEHGKLTLQANPKMALARENKQMLIDSFAVHVPLPQSIASANLTCPKGGTVRFDEDSKTVVWQIGKLAGQENKVEGTLTYCTDPKEGKALIPAEEKSCAQVSFVVKGWASSGIRLDACEISGVNYSPYKASRYTTKSGKIDFRLP